MKKSVYIAASLDGYIARADGDLDWLMSAGGNGEDYGYETFFASVDALVMGRGTYEKVLTFGEWPYGDKPVVILSRRALDIPAEICDRVEVSALAPPALVAALAGRGMQRIYVDGGKVIQSFLRAGLIDDITLTHIPVLIGDGIPLFGPLHHDIHLRHIATESFASGMVQSTYEVVS